MKNFLLLCLFLHVFSATAHAQTTHSITVGPNVGIPINNQYNAKMSFGISGEYIYKFTPHFAARLYTGYNRFRNKFSNDFASFWSTRVGLQVFFNRKEQVFIFADNGPARYTGPLDKQTGASSSIGFGLRQRVANKIFQFSGYIESNNFNYTWVNIRAAYGFGFGKER